MVAAGVMVATLAVGLLKPWGAGLAAPSPDGHPSDRAEPTALGLSAPDQSAASASVEPDASIGGPCYYRLAQRLFTSDTSSNGLVHTWYGLDPVAASGPGDRSIPVVVVHSRTLGQLGYCLVMGESPTAHVLATLAWVLAPDGEARPLDLERAPQVPPVDPDEGAIFEPPAAITGTDPGIWPAATYVFEIQLQTAPAEWFAVRVS
jgi:hypothetical protein